MCFSAEASFGSAAVLIPMGVYGLNLAARRQPARWPFALVPLVFGIQQLCEGLVWWGWSHGQPRVATMAAGLFLFFAIAWWPFWFPVAGAIATKSRRGRMGLTLLAILSLGWFFFGFLPAAVNPQVGLKWEIVHHSIHYPYADNVIFADSRRWLLTLVYSATMAISTLVLGLKVFLPPLILGIISFVVSEWVYHHSYTSVWCFFAALLSVYCVAYFAIGPKEIPRNDRPGLS